MQIGRMLHRNAETYLVHLFGRGLDDERYVIERYRSLASGEIRSVHAEELRTKGQRKRRRTIASVGADKKMRPERDEIIVCTALNLKASGVQLWGAAATGLLAARVAR